MKWQSLFSEQNLTKKKKKKKKEIYIYIYKISAKIFLSMLSVNSLTPALLNKLKCHAHF